MKMQFDFSAKVRAVASRLDSLTINFLGAEATISSGILECLYKHETALNVERTKPKGIKEEGRKKEERLPPEKRVHGRRGDKKAFSQTVS